MHRVDLKLIMVARDRKRRRAVGVSSRPFSSSSVQQGLSAIPITSILTELYQNLGGFLALFLRF